MKYNLLEKWVTEMNGGDLGRLTSLYSQDAILFATFEEQPLDTPDLIHGYFKSFFSLEGAGVELDSSTVTNSELGENCYSSTGLYTFFFMDRFFFIKKLELKETKTSMLYQLLALVASNVVISAKRGGSVMEK